MRERGNVAELAFEQLAVECGFDQTKRGWPDFLCTRGDGSKFAVEVKPRTSSGRLKLLKRDQVATLTWLTSLGVECFVSDGHGLEPYDAAIHGDPSRRRISSPR